MSIAVGSESTRFRVIAAASLNVAARLWFLVAVVGQVVFAAAVAVFYSRATARGDFLAWNKFMTHGYVQGHHLDNAAVAVHLGMAVIMSIGGVLQLVPQIRARAPAFHRWNGRAYLTAALALSVAGLYIVWVRGTPGDVWEHLGISLNGVLILLCAAMALRTALARDFTTHRRWALRLFIVASGVWFFRLGVILSFIIFHGPFGFNPRTFEGPFVTFMTFAQYLLPLGVLELYLWAQDHRVAPARLVMATGLFMLTIAMGAGIAAAGLGLWLPLLQAPFANRTSIIETLSATIASSGIDAAVSQYKTIKATHAATYNLDESELDHLGYELLHAGRFKDAIRILQLNVEAYPASGNTYDSLGEAYLDDGDKPDAIANYRKSLVLDPHNQNAVDTLKVLYTP